MSAPPQDSLDAIIKDHSKDPDPVLARRADWDPLDAIIKDTSKDSLDAIIKDTSKSPSSVIAKEAAEDSLDAIIKDTSKEAPPRQRIAVTQLLPQIRNMDDWAIGPAPGESLVRVGSEGLWDKTTVIDPKDPDKLEMKVKPYEYMVLPTAETESKLFKDAQERGLFRQSPDAPSGLRFQPDLPEDRPKARPGVVPGSFADFWRMYLSAGWEAKKALGFAEEPKGPRVIDLDKVIKQAAIRSQPTQGFYIEEDWYPGKTPKLQDSGRGLLNDVYDTFKQNFLGLGPGVSSAISRLSPTALGFMEFDPQRTGHMGVIPTLIAEAGALASPEVAAGAAFYALLNGEVKDPGAHLAICTEYNSHVLTEMSVRSAENKEDPDWWYDSYLASMGMLTANLAQLDASKRENPEFLSALERARRRRDAGLWERLTDADFGQLIRNTMREVPGALFFPVHLGRAAAKSVMFWGGAGRTAEKLRGSADIASHIGEHMYHRGALTLTGRWGELSEAGLFKMFLDMGILASIPAGVARTAARYATKKAIKELGPGRFRYERKGDLYAVKEVADPAAKEALESVIPKSSRPDALMENIKIAEEVVTTQTSRLVTLDKAKKAAKSRTDSYSNSAKKGGYESHRANKMSKEIDGLDARIAQRRLGHPIGYRLFEEKGYTYNPDAIMPALAKKFKKAANTRDNSLRKAAEIDAKIKTSTTKGAVRAKDKKAAATESSFQLLFNQVTATEEAITSLIKQLHQLGRRGRIPAGWTRRKLLRVRATLTGGKPRHTKPNVPEQFADVRSVIADLGRKRKALKSQLGRIVQAGKADKTLSRRAELIVGRAKHKHKAAKAGEEIIFIESLSAYRDASRIEILRPALAKEVARPITSKSLQKRKNAALKKNTPAALEELKQLRRMQNEYDLALLGSASNELAKIREIVAQSTKEIAEAQSSIRLHKILVETLPKKRVVEVDRAYLRQVMGDAGKGVSAQAHYDKAVRAEGYLQMALDLEKAASAWMKAAHYGIPLVGQVAAINDFKNWVINRPSVWFPGRRIFGVDRGKAKLYLMDADKRVPFMLQAIQRNAAGQSAYFQQRMAEWLKLVPEEDLPHVHRMAKYEHAETVKYFTRNHTAKSTKELEAMSTGELVALAKDLDLFVEQLLKRHPANLWHTEAPEQAMRAAVMETLLASGQRRFSIRESAMADLRAAAIEEVRAAIKASAPRPQYVQKGSRTGTQSDFGKVEQAWESVQESVQVAATVADKYKRLQKTLTIYNKYDDLLDYLQELHQLAKDAGGLYNPGKANPVYYAETIDRLARVENRLRGIKGYYTEYAEAAKKTGRLPAMKDTIISMLRDLEALREIRRSRSVGQALVKNTRRQKGRSVEEAEAGYIDETGKLRKISQDPVDALLLKSPEIVRELEWLRGYNELAQEASLFRGFKGKYAPGEKLNSAEALKELEALYAKRAERIQVGKQPTKKLSEKIARAEDKLEDAHLKEGLEEAGWVECSQRVTLEIEGVGTVRGSKPPGDFVFGPGRELRGIINSPIKGGPIHKRGNLQGMMHPDIAYELAGIEGMTGAYGALANTIMKAPVSFFKAVKTVGTFGTHVTNWLGNILFLAPMSGLSMWNPQNWNYYQKAAKDFASRTKSSQYKRWLRSGGRGPGGAANRAEFVAAVEQNVGVMFQGILGNAELIHKNVAAFTKGIMTGDWRLVAKATGRAGMKVFNSPFAAYQMADDFHRYANFLKEIDNAGALNAANKTVDAQAALQGRINFADYENLAGSFQVMRDRWWGQPFVSFDARTVPLAYRRIMDTPVRSRFVLGLHEFMVEHNRVTADVDTTALAEALNKQILIPGYEDRKTWLAEIFPELLDTKYKFLRIDLTKYVPFMRRMPYEDEDLFKWLGRAFLFENPGFVSLGAFLNNHNFHFGSPVVQLDSVGETGDSRETIVRKYNEAFWQLWLPGDFLSFGYGTASKKLKLAQEGALRGDTKTPRSMLEAVLAHLGVNASDMTPERLTALLSSTVTRAHFSLLRKEKSVASAYREGRIGRGEMEEQAKHLAKRRADILVSSYRNDEFINALIDMFPEAAYIKETSGIELRRGEEFQSVITEAAPDWYKTLLDASPSE